LDQGWYAENVRSVFKFNVVAVFSLKKYKIDLKHDLFIQGSVRFGILILLLVKNLSTVSK
jgi:hypothetical protein